MTIPLLPLQLHWAKRNKTSSVFHIADHAGRMLCDAGPSMSRGINEPVEGSNIHALCLNALKTRRSI